MFCATNLSRLTGVFAKPAPTPRAKPPMRFLMSVLGAASNRAIGLRSVPHKSSAAIRSRMQP